MLLPQRSFNFIIAIWVKIRNPIQPRIRLPSSYKKVLTTRNENIVLQCLILRMKKWLFALVMAFMMSCEKATKLPIYFNSEPPVRFALINQDSLSITEQSFAHEIYIADFFFSTCPGICVKMTNEMKHIQATFKDEKRVRQLSISVDPKRDTPSRLTSYALRNEITTPKWQLATGDYEHIFNLSKNTFHCFALQDAIAEDEIFHDERLILVDGNGRIRGFYPIMDSLALKQLIKDTRILLAEQSSN